MNMKGSNPPPTYDAPEPPPVPPSKTENLLAKTFLSGDDLKKGQNVFISKELADVLLKKFRFDPFDCETKTEYEMRLSFKSDLTKIKNEWVINE